MATTSKASGSQPAQDGTTIEPTRVLPHDPYGHGHSVAAWAAVAIVMVGSLIATVGFIVANVPVTIVGGVIALLGGPIGKILGAMGFGSGNHSTR